MKKKITLGFLNCLLLISMLVFALNSFFTFSSNEKLFANASDDNAEITVLEIGDELYMQLLFIRDGQYPQDISTVEPLRENTFIDYTEIDLSNCSNVSSNGKLSYIGGLAFFRFDNLKILNLSNNDLTKIPAQTFYNITSLTTLDISNNDITEISFGNLTTLQNFYAQNNKLASIDLSTLQNIDNVMGEINLAQNNFSSTSDIILPSNSHPKYVELYGNNILDANYDVTSYAPHQLNFIMQSIKQDTEIDDKTEIEIFPSFGLHNYKVKFTNTETTLSQTLGAGKHYLGVGQYQVEIYDGDNNLSSLTGTVYKGFEFIVVKSAPTVSAYIDGKLIDYNTKITKPVTLKFDSGNEDYIIEYSINGGEYVAGNEVTLEKRGKYNIFVKSTNGQNVSKILSVGVEIEATEDNFATIFIIILIIAGLGVGVMILRVWMKD